MEPRCVNVHRSFHTSDLSEEVVARRFVHFPDATADLRQQVLGLAIRCADYCFRRLDLRWRGVGIFGDPFRARWINSFAFRKVMTRKLKFVVR